MFCLGCVMLHNRVPRGRGRPGSSWLLGEPCWEQLGLEACPWSGRFAGQCPHRCLRQGAGVWGNALAKATALRHSRGAGITVGFEAFAQGGHPEYDVKATSGCHPALAGFWRKKFGEVASVLLGEVVMEPASRSAGRAGPWCYTAGLGRSNGVDGAAGKCRGCWPKPPGREETPSKS